MTNRFLARQGWRTTLVIAACLRVAVAAGADVAPDGHVYGYQDAKTGTFHPLAAVVPDVVAPTTGTVQVTFAIKLVTTFAKGTDLYCTVTLEGLSVNATTGSSTSYTETGTGTAAISGTTATCKVVIPYSWLVTPASSTGVDSFSGDYSVTAAVPSTPTTVLLAYSGSRSSSSSVFSTTKIPASGTTSVYTVNVTL